MWNGFRYIIFASITAGIVVCFLAIRVGAASGREWANSSIRVVAQTPAQNIAPTANSCYGTMVRVHIRYTGDADACVTGELGKTHLARYQSTRYQFAYAIARGDDEEYTKIENFCVGLSWCAYSSSEDTLLMGAPAVGSYYGSAYVKNFISHLTLHALPELHYTFQYDAPSEPISVGAVSVGTGALALSSNGRWAIIELIGYGFARVDMKTGAYRRVVAPGALYGMGADPSYELAISNDGRFIAITGWNGDFSFYQLDGSCGDALSETTGRYFQLGVIPCPSVYIGAYYLFPGFRLAEEPRFSDDGMQLTVHVVTNTSTLKATITPLASTIVPGKGLYAALGDSFVSGEGEINDSFYIPSTNRGSNKCHVSRRSYPYLVHSTDLLSTVNLACSGSRTDELRQQSADLKGIALSQPLKNLSLGVGGNDVNLMGKLKTCIGIGTCEWAQPKKRIQTATEIQQFYPHMVRFLREVRQAHPEANMYFVGYPKVINDSDSADCHFPISTLLDTAERRYMNETVHYLNEILAAASRSVDIPFIDIENVFEGERLCDAKQDAMNGIRSGDDFSPVTSLTALKLIGAESFHPTPRGHELVAARIREQISKIDFAQLCDHCGESINLTPPDYWREYIPAEVAPTLKANSFLKSDIVAKNTTETFQFPKQSFMPDSIVRLELHSNPEELGMFRADSEGALKGEFTIPSDISGYHTVHALGTSSSGDAIDRYEIVYVGEATPATSSNEGANLTISGGKTLQKGRVLSAVSTTREQGQQTLLKNIYYSHNNPPNWYVICAVGGTVCLISIILAYSIGRRQV